MDKITILFFSVILSILSLSGFVIVHHQVSVGAAQLAQGQLQFQQGATALKSGEARLAHGEKELSHAKREYKGIGHVPIIGFLVKHSGAKKEIHQGDRQVAAGKAKVEDGKTALAEAQDQLMQGEAKLKAGEIILQILGSLSIIFIFITGVLCYLWKNIVLQKIMQIKKQIK